MAQTADLTQDLDETVVSVRTRRNPRGDGSKTFTGADRVAVLAAALDEYRNLDAEWRMPTYPVTYAVPGGWAALVEFGSVE